MNSDQFEDLPFDHRRRDRLVQQLGDFSSEVQEAFRRVPRHWFVPERDRAYVDAAMPIGGGQTISQPYVIAVMLDALSLRPGERVLDVGSGSGYVASLLAHLVGPDGMVYALERRQDLATAARRVIAAATVGAAPVVPKVGDGLAGLPEHAPYAAIHVACAPVAEPPALREQLEPGGRMVLPCGPFGAQELILVERKDDGYRRSKLLDVRFVPMLEGME